MTVWNIIIKVVTSHTRTSTRKSKTGLLAFFAHVTESLYNLNYRKCKGDKLTDITDKEYVIKNNVFEN